MKNKFTWPGWEFPLLALSVVLFFILRTANLSSIPVYLDEAIYINWAHLFNLDKKFAYFSMQDGKTPLYFWIVSLFLNFFRDPLVAARIVSVITGAGTMLASWFMTRTVFGKKTALFFLPLYLLVPYAQFMERMAFADSLLCFLGILSLTLTLTIIKSKNGRFYFPRLAGAVLTGVVLGLAYLTKSSAKVYLFLIFFLLFSQIIIAFKKPKKCIFLLFTGLIIWVFYSEIITAFRTGASRFFLNIAEKERLLTFSITEIFKNPLNTIYKTNFSPFAEYFFSYFGIVFLAIIFFAAIKIIKKKSSLEIVFILMTVVTGTGIFFSAKLMASRYFLPVVPFLVIIGARGLEEIYSLFRNKYVFAVIVLLVLIPWLTFDLRLSLSPTKAKFSSQDKNFLFESDLSGIGIEEAIRFLLTSLTSQNTVLAIDTYWGQSDYIELKILRLKNKDNRFTLKKYGHFSDSYRLPPQNEKKEKEKCLKSGGKIVSSEKGLICLTIIPEEIRKMTVGNKVFLLSLTGRDNTSLFTREENLVLVKDFPRMAGKDGIIKHTLLYEVLGD